MMPGAAKGLRILVLLTDAYGGHGGIAAYNRDVLGALCADPDVAEVVALPRLAALPLGPLPAKLTFDLAALGGGPRYLSAVVKHLSARGGFDLVYCAHLNLIPVARLAAAIARAPMILAVYGIDAWEPHPRLMVRKTAGSADHVLSISQVTLDRFRGWQSYPDASCSLMPNAIHLEQFGIGPKNADLLAQYGLAGRKVLMTFGRLAGSERYKGFDAVLDAMPELVREMPDIVYVIAGDGSDRERLEQKARDMGMAGHVVFTGMVDEADKAELYRLADVYVMPSQGEGFGFVLLEAMACGVPTIASTADGGREALRNGLLGLLVDPENPIEIIDAVRASFDRPRGIPEGLEYFSFPQFSRRLRTVVHAVIDRARGG